MTVVMIHWQVCFSEKHLKDAGVCEITNETICVSVVGKLAVVAPYIYIYIYI